MNKRILCIGWLLFSLFLCEEEKDFTVKWLAPSLSKAPLLDARIWFLNLKQLLSITEALNAK